jgi:hypothetical protein
MNIIKASGSTVCIVVIFAAAISSAVRADESGEKLKATPDVALVVSKCTICHSIDYIKMNAPFMKRAGWEAEVRKMVKVMGAPVDDAEFTRIVDYLTQQYGTQ